jgi:hypothetical protein
VTSDTWKGTGTAMSPPSACWSSMPLFVVARTPTGWRALGKSLLERETRSRGLVGTCSHHPSPRRIAAKCCGTGEHARSGTTLLGARGKIPRRSFRQCPAFIASLRSGRARVEFTVRCAPTSRSVVGLPALRLAGPGRWDESSRCGGGLPHPYSPAAPQECTPRT